MDFQIIAYKDSAPISGVNFAPGAALVALEIDGRNFIEVTEVLINGIPSPEFGVLSERRIVAQIPVSELTRPIRTVSVLTAGAGTTGASVISFRQAGGRQEATGITYIVQSFLTLLLSSPGSDIFNPELGAGLLDIIPQAGPNNPIRAYVSQALSRASSQLIRLQSFSALEPSDKFASARLVEASYDPQTASVSVRVQISSAAGQSANAGVLLSTEAL